MKKRILSIALALCMIVTLLPATALAEGEVLSGVCGESLSWTFDNGTLTVSGTGDMDNYSSKSDIPWYQNANNISSIVVEKGVTHIGEMAFRDCVNAVSVSIPEGVKTIGKYAFKECDALESVVVPEGVESLGDYAFDSCAALTGVTLPKSLRVIGRGAFRNCFSLTDFTIPYGVKTISYGAFEGCRGLKSITVPESVTSLAGYVFSCCDGLESIKLNCRIQTIYNGVFEHCSGLKTLTVPSGVKTIKRYAFEFCTRLESIKLPVSLKLIEDCAFRCCDSLTDVYYEGSQTQWNGIETWDDLDRMFQGKMHYNCAYESTSNFSITTSAGKPKLSWKAVSGADKYWVYRGTSNDNLKYYDTTTKTSYTNKSTDIGTTYYYMVKAIDANGKTNTVLDTSVVKSIMCRPAAPSISIYRSNGKPQLKWTAVDGASKYWIYRSTDGEEYKYYDMTTKTSYTNTGAKSGTKYYYKVKAVAVVNKNNVPSAYSNSKNLITTLKAPTLYGTCYNSRPFIRWASVDGADRYWIYRSTDGKNFKYYETVKNCEYRDSNCFLGTTYYYKVKAVCAESSYANSPLSAVKSIKSVPDAPYLNIKLNNNKPMISWEASAFADKYWIYRSTDGKNFKYYDTTARTSYTNKSTSAGTTYYYKVKAVTVVNGKNVISDYSNTVSIKAK
ncbi:MAG: leucine-rich repeat protein [Oscillospiraceae bacterium]|nr:leucine-rich repeat protein [Oscillospiraceae bacterium]